MTEKRMHCHNNIAMIYVSNTLCKQTHRKSLKEKHVHSVIEKPTALQCTRILNNVHDCTEISDKILYKFIIVSSKKKKLCVLVYSYISHVQHNM